MNASVGSTGFDTAALRVVSIEPIDPIESMARKISADCGMQLISGNSTSINLPFCGLDYHAKNFVVQSSPDSVRAEFDRCVAEITGLESNMADGFVESINGTDMTEPTIYPFGSRSENG